MEDSFKNGDLDVAAEISQMLAAKSAANALKERRIVVSLLLSTTVGAIAAVGLMFIGIGGSTADVVSLCVMYLLSMVGVELGYHRYFTHKAFKARPWFETTLAILGSMSLQGPLIWWCAIHRIHHGNTDQAGDPHSPNSFGGSRLTRFFHAHSGWLFNEACVSPPQWNGVAKDLYRNKRVFTIHMQYWAWGILGLIIPGIAQGLIFQSWLHFCTGILWGGFLRVFLCHHFFWSLNSICHLWGGQHFSTNDQSRNNAFVALVTLGQGWHNNHHAFPFSSRVGLLPFQLDIGWYILLALRRVGVVTDLRTPSQELRLTKTLKTVK